MAMIKDIQHTLHDGTKVLLRTGMDTDAEQMQKCIIEYVEDNTGMSWARGEFVPTVEFQEKWIREMLHRPDEVLIVAEINGEIVGNIDFHIGARRRISHAGEFAMAIRAAWRGQGIGPLLLEQLIAWARESHTIEKINLRVLSNNNVAMTMYKKFGFVEEGRRCKEIKFEDGTYVDDVYMALFIK